MGTPQDRPLLGSACAFGRHHRPLALSIMMRAAPPSSTADVSSSWSRPDCGGRLLPADHALPTRLDSPANRLYSSSISLSVTCSGERNARGSGGLGQEGEASQSSLSAPCHGVQPRGRLNSRPAGLHLHRRVALPVRRGVCRRKIVWFRVRVTAVPSTVCVCRSAGRLCREVPDCCSARSPL
jgi:hypothetical protein